MDAAVGATHSLRGRNPPRAAAARAAISVGQTYVRKRKRPRAAATQDIPEEDDSDDHDMVDESEDQQGGADLESEARMDEDESFGHATAGDGGFRVDDDSLI